MGINLSKHHHDEGERVLVAGRPNYNRCDNMIVTSKYTLWSFLPVVSYIISFEKQCVEASNDVLQSFLGF
jgi:hypothetical protein